MKNIFTAVILFSLIGVGIAIAATDSILNTSDLQVNGSYGDLVEIPGSSDINNTLNQESVEVIPDETTVFGMKGPRSNLTFSSLSNSSSNISGSDMSPDQEYEGQSSDNISSNTSLSQYESLGDIIRAKDWKALGEYQCKMKTENSASFADTGISNGDQESKWNGYFNYREPVVVSYPCCG